MSKKENEYFKLEYLPYMAGVIIGIFMMSFSLYSIIKSAETIDNNINDFNNKISELEGQLSECRKYNDFTNALEKIGSIPYSTTENCYEHSKKMQQELRLSGIESSIMINKDRSHAWLSVWIEATTGHFIKPNQYSVMELRDNNLNVICSI